MNDDQFDDLKQFIETTVGQTEARLGTRMDGTDARIDGMEARLTARIERVEGRLSSLEQKVDDGFAAIGDAIDQIHLRIDEHEKDHSAHGGRLQPQAA